MALQPRRQ